MATIEIKNQSNVKLLFSIFNEGDDFAPFSHDWVDPDHNKTMDRGDFLKVGVGVQTQSGGVWISSPKDGPKFEKDQECVFNIIKEAR